MQKFKKFNSPCNISYYAKHKTSLVRNRKEKVLLFSLRSKKLLGYSWPNENI